MKEELGRIVREAENDLSAWNRAREYLQARILGLLQETGAMIPLAFCGGTALRFLYSLPRFSEDLDFSLERKSSDFHLESCIKRVADGLAREGYDIELRSRSVSAVHGVMIKFPGLPFELGLSPHAGQVLSIKVEVDTNPPEGAGLEVSMVRRFILLRLQHHDRSSLLAGKLHAVFVRNFTKGRDYYDLMWYMTDPNWPPPNMNFLRNALIQTGWKRERVLSMDVVRELKEKFRTVNWKEIRRDVTPFLERPSEAEFLTEDNMVTLLEGFISRPR
jgi:hypothetical protein